MLKIFRHRKSGFFVWAILILLMVGLAGFGVSTAGNGSGQVVLTVGDTEVPATDYSRALKQEVDAISNQLGRQLPMSEARQYGIDRMVLSRLASDAALDDEASRLGLSVGDPAVHALLVATPAFRGPDGKFDTLTYDAALQRAGLARGTYEDMLRAEATRDMLAGAIQAPVAMPAVAADTLLAYAGERRRFDWIDQRQRHPADAAVEAAARRPAEREDREQVADQIAPGRAHHVGEPGDARGGVLEDVEPGRAEAEPGEQGHEAEPRPVGDAQGEHGEGAEAHRHRRGPHRHLGLGGEGQRRDAGGDQDGALDPQAGAFRRPKGFAQNLTRCGGGHRTLRRCVRSDSHAGKPRACPVCNCEEDARHATRTPRRDLCETLGAVAPDPFTRLKMRLRLQDMFNDYNISTPFSRVKSSPPKRRGGGAAFAEVSQARR